MLLFVIGVVIIFKTIGYEHVLNSYFVMIPLALITVVGGNILGITIVEKIVKRTKPSGARKD